MMELGIPGVYNYLDTILMFRGAHSELDRDLYTMGTLYTDVPDWKSGGGDERNVAVNPRSDLELHTYNGLDGVVDARCVPALVEEVERRGQTRAVGVDHGIQAICREMHHIGIGRVNEPKRQAKEKVLTEKASMLKARMWEAIGRKFNPNSVNDLTALFLDDWHLPVTTWTDTMEPSWDDATLRAYRSGGLLTAPQLAVIDDLRAFRTAVKSLGYLKAWRPWNDYRLGSDGKTIRGGRCGPDGRLHPHWNVHCYDAETEILTADGWVKFPDLADGVAVAQWSDGLGTMNFVVPSVVRRDWHVGPMHRFESQDTDLLVTPDHRMLWWKDGRTSERPAAVGPRGATCHPRAMALHKLAQHGLVLGDWGNNCTWRFGAVPTETIVPYEGMVYCVNVPSSWVVVRRNGKVTISGNTPRTGRISGSNPAPQNVESELRELVEPEEGHVYAAADFDQIELRLIAVLAGLKNYLKVFAIEGDPHAVTAVLIYGETFLKALRAILTPEQWAIYERDGAPPKANDRRLAAFLTGWGENGGEALKILREEGKSYPSEEAARVAVAGMQQLAKMYKQLRTFAKTFVYAVIYGGTAMTVYQSVSAAEDPKTGKLLFPDMGMPEIRAAYDSFMANAPELKAWWEGAWAFARKHLHISEPVLGRRRDFPQFERNEILNMPVQGAAAGIMSLGLLKLRAVLPPGKFGPRTGIVAQVHDFGMTEVPESEGQWAIDQINECFTMQFGGVRFGATAGVAHNWMTA